MKSFFFSSIIIFFYLVNAEYFFISVKKDQLYVIQIAIISQRSTSECLISLIYRGKMLHVILMKIWILFNIVEHFFKVLLRISKHIKATKPIHVSLSPISYQAVI